MRSIIKYGTVMSALLVTVIGFSGCARENQKTDQKESDISFAAESDAEKTEMDANPIVAEESVSAGEVMTDTTAEAAEETTAEETTAEETTAEETTAEETTAEETTADETTAEGDYVYTATGEKYLALSKMNLFEARKYFMAEEDEKKTSEDFDQFLSGIFVESVTTDRLSLSQMVNNPEQYGIDCSVVPYSLGNLIPSEEERKKSFALDEEELKEMLSFPYEKLTDRQQLAFDKLYAVYINELWGLSVPDFSSPLAVTSGLISNIGITFFEYSFESQEDVEQYFLILNELPKYLITLPECVKEQIDSLSYLPNESMYDASIKAAESLCDLDDNPFIDGFNDKIDALGLDAETAGSYKEQNRKFYSQKMVPVLSKVKKDLILLSESYTGGKGLCEYEGGAEYYEYLVSQSVGTSRSIDEMMKDADTSVRNQNKRIFQLAIAHSDEIQKYVNGECHIPVEEDPMQILSFLTEKMSGDYPELGDVEYQCSYLPKSLEIDGVIAYYLLPRINFSGTNIIRVNQSATEGDEITLYTSLAHEGYPGHMLYFNHMRKNELDVESLISSLGATEGWAMYAGNESIKAAFDETTAEIIKLDTQIGYDLCAYFDMAVNAKGYSVEDVSDYLAEVGMGGDMDMAQIFYDSAVSDPGALLPYSLGYLYTDELITKYMEENQTEKKEACEAYMNIGTGSFEVIEKYMELEGEK